MEAYIFEAMLGALLFGICGMAFKWNAHLGGDENYFFTGLYLIGGLCFLGAGIDEIYRAGDLIYLVMAVIVGLGSAGGNYAFSHGLRRGPAGLSTAFAKANIVFVILASAFYYGEKISLMETMGILFFLAAMLIVNIKTRKSQKDVTGVWFLIMLTSMVLLAFRNGGLKVAEELELSNTVILAISYLLCASYFITNIIINRKIHWAAKTTKKRIILMGMLTGVGSYAGLDYYVTALETGPASIVVTLFSLDMFFVLLMSYLLFGERLNRNQKIGFALSATGFILIGLK